MRRRVAKFPLPLLVLGSIVLAPASFAQTASPTCPEGDYTVEVEGGVVVQAQDVEDNGERSTFLKACLQAQGWTISAPEIVVLNGQLSAATAELRGPGFAGTAELVTGSAEKVTVQGARLSLEVTADSVNSVRGLPPGRYAVTARQASLEDESLSFGEAIFDHIGPDGRVDQRLRAHGAVSSGGTLHVATFEYATSRFDVRSADADLSGANATLHDVRVTLSRDASAQGIGFNAERAMLDLSRGDLTVYGLAVRLYSVLLPPLPLGAISFDPQRPLDVPYRVSFGDGLTVGLDGYRLGEGRGPTLSLLANRVFTARPSLSFSLNASREGVNLALQQPLDAPLSASVGSDPPNGPVFGISVNSGRRVLDPAFRSPATAEASAGYAVSGSLGAASGRLRVDAGQAYQDAQDPQPGVPSSQQHSLSFGRAITSGTAALQSGAFSVRLAATGILVAYAPSLDYAGGLGSGMTADLGASYSTPPFAASVALSYGQQFTPFAIRAHAVSNYTTLSANLSLTPQLQTPPLGYNGIAVEKPTLNAAFKLDLRQIGTTSALQSLALSGRLDLSWYDGTVSRDFLDQPFQTPRLTVSPAVSYDIATRSGEAGADLTVYDCCLAFTGGAYRTFAPAGDGWRFNLGVRLR